jgi:AraC-like DNA-binding protein
MRTLGSLIVLGCIVSSVSGQLTEAMLTTAVVQQDCRSIAEALDTTALASEEMKFHGAVCFYRNGSPERALPLFQEVRHMGGKRSQIATYWESKIHAVSGRDSLVMATLQALPSGFLNTALLSRPEFDQINGSNDAFARLKKSFAPGFNFWTAILAIIAGIGLCTSILLFFGRSRFSAGERWLSAAVFAFAVIMISYVLIWTRYAAEFPYLNNIWQFLTLCVGPSIFFYLKATFKEDITRKEIAMHYAIPLVSLLFTLPAILRNFGIAHGVSSDFWRIGTSSTLLTGHLLFYAIYISFITRNEWQIDANIRTWTRTISHGMWVYTLAFISYFILVSTSFFNPEWDYAISFTMSLGILGITYMGLIQKRVFSSEPIATFLPVQKYQSSSLTTSASNSIRTRLDELMDEQQVFKENELRLDDLASYLDITRHQLSQVINEHYGVNFFELINRYRVAYVKQTLLDPHYRKHTIIQIAYEAGFNNKASFNRYFKQETGMTPSEWRMREVDVLIEN